MLNEAGAPVVPDGGIDPNMMGSMDPNAAMMAPQQGGTEPDAIPTPPSVPASPPQPEKDMPINGEELINALNLMDPERVKKYIKNTQSSILNLPNEIDNTEARLDASTPEISDEGIESNLSDTVLSAADILKRYLILRKLASAAADVIKILKSDRIQQGQIDKDMPDINPEEKDLQQVDSAMI